MTTEPPSTFLRRIRLVDPVSKPRAILVALLCVTLAAMMRLLLEQFVAGLLPFLFTFPAVIAAALVGGALAGWVALSGCQLLTLAFVLPHWIRDSGDRPQEAVNLLLATFSLALALWAADAWREAERGLRRQCEREVRTLSLLANEVDHRTKNNFQMAAALLHAQGMAADRAVREELNAAAGRLVSIGAIYGKLSSREPEAGAVALLDHIGEIGEGLQAGLLPPGVALTVHGDAGVVPTTAALIVGLVVNEWITNAVKYAFAGSEGTIRVELARRQGMLHVEVRDDGVGISSDRPQGTGSRLLASLVEVLNGRIERRNEQGTVCTLTMPLNAS